MKTVCFSCTVLQISTLMACGHVSLYKAKKYKYFCVHEKLIPLKKKHCLYISVNTPFWKTVMLHGGIKYKKISTLKLVTEEMAKT